ncbi:cell division protein FtsA [Thermodesulfovibrio yellowstonii]|jgi:cell division protein FtsA|uniref:Cell division protein FtsA n=1 Tax=Thermodesulfovibrio yellowstonii (strain ATCC 51303 / DSM 11347 / YP87) TaxID=289376 RepID=B5YFS9_THEYD|nr:cell division protein FtsA [Thermodesulfovibrio yellowstonii]ACI21365.1 cell division protein FtsA [Thermodesulfovibrio yellowstonii DSM 11347]
MSEMIKVIDIGTTKISFAGAKIESGKLVIDFLKSYPSAGLKRGKIVDMEAMISSIKKSLQDIESTLGIRLKKAFVCSSGSDIEGICSNAAVKVKKREVTEQDVDLAIEAATAMQIPYDRQAVHILPVEFVVDGVNGIKDPVGMKALRLESKVYIITASSSHIQNLITCCNKAGIEVEDIVLQSVASSEATLSEHDKEMGTLVVDIGGGSIDMAVFYDGYLRHVATYGIGGNHITNDLAIGLKIPFHEAERIKTQFGVALPDIRFGSLKFKENEKDIEIVGLDKHSIKIPLNVIKEIIYARCEEILEVLKKEFTSIPQDISISSVVFTGGTSLMQGFISLAEGFLSIPARIGKPDTGLMTVCSEFGLDESIMEQKEEFEEIFTPEFASTIGTIIYAIKTRGFSESYSGLAKLFSKIGTWIMEKTLRKFK